MTTPAFASLGETIAPIAKLKALLRKTAARTIDDLWPAIADSLDAFTPT